MLLRRSKELFGIGLLGSVAALVVACSSSTDKGPASAAPEARSTLARDQNPTVAAGDLSALIDGNTAFAFDLYGKLADGTQNFFCSPLSVSVALGMTWAGARGATETQTAGALHFTLPQERLHPAFNKLLLDLDTRNVAPHQTLEGTKTIELRLANAAWAQKNYSFVPVYLDALAVNYDAGVKLLDFAADPPGSTDLINVWVAEQTEDKIQKLIPDGVITPATRLVLTNTLYFYANWATVFETNATRDAAFHAPGADVTVPMMHAGLSVPYAAGDGWAIADLPYDDKLVMTFVLPDTGRFDEIRSAMTGEWLAQALGQMSAQEVSLAVPKFRFTWGTTSLNQALVSLGMVDAFDSTKADFSGIEPTRELYVGQVLHQAFVGVDESGTEAAAATAVVMAGSAAPARSLVLDRPFVFFIRDKVTGTLLFVGQVVDPTQS